MLDLLQVTQKVIKSLDGLSKEDGIRILDFAKDCVTRGPDMISLGRSAKKAGAVAPDAPEETAAAPN